MQAVQFPDWLTGDFLRSCLESDTKNFSNVVINDFSVESAVPPGNNYGSLMLRANIRYKIPGKSIDEEMTTLVIKAPLTKGFRDLSQEFYEEIAETEPRYYNQFIPETYKLRDHDVVPRCYKSPILKCVVMEDLKAKGFKMVDRRELLDYEHCVLFAKASSKLHAFSIAIRKNKPGFVENLGTPDVKVKEHFDKIMRTMIYNGLRCMVAFLENLPAYKEFLDIFTILIDNDKLWRMYDDVEKIVRPLMAVTQGDPWCTNMMFKYDHEGNVQSIKILDFQFLKFTSPVLEFLSFLWMSANLDVKTSRLDELYKIYNDSLNENLANLGCSERLSYEDQMSEAKTLSPIVFMVVCSMIPFVIADGEMDQNALSEDNLKLPVQETPFWKSYEGENFKKYYPKILDIVKKEGYLDDMSKRVSTENRD